MREAADRRTGAKRATPALPEALSWFTPLPPARNGIADYSAMLLGEIAALTPCACYCEDPGAIAPQGVEVRDPLQAFRYLSPRSRILHQIGNNGGHVFALEALRRHGGVVSLHDLSLLYVYELATEKRETLYGHMQRPHPALGAVFARHWKDRGLKTPANYILFDMIGEILSRASRVIVHSDYARRKIAATHGEAAARKLAVIPHFAKPIADASAAAARERLGLAQDVPLILTSGFATRSKRFDWLLDSLSELRNGGHSFRWIHAGQERAEEFPLTERIRAKGLADVASVTGYLSEDDLDSHIVAADLVVNLRFPSVGESSGTLARAFSAGRCCIVNDTAAYTEIPRDAVVHIPVFGTVEALTRALAALLADDALRQTFGERARAFARSSLSIARVARAYLEVIDQAEEPAAGRAERPARKARSAGPARHSVDVGSALPDLSSMLAPGTQHFDLTLWFASADHLAATSLNNPALLAGATGAHVDIESVTFVSADGHRRRSAGQIGLKLTGRAFG